MENELKKISEILRQYRKRNKLSLRSFCQKYKLDSVTISILERGLDNESDFKYLSQAIKKIKEIKDKNISIIECPKCGKSLHFSKNELNGHIWGKCETKDCLGWIQ
jgi:transcriptional regulator with XRE-family HTH domain